MLHRQNAINFDAGKLLDQGKKKRAGKLKKAVSFSSLYTNCTLLIGCRMTLAYLPISVLMPRGFYKSSQESLSNHASTVNLS